VAARFDSYLADEDAEAYRKYSVSAYKANHEEDPLVPREAFAAQLYGYKTTSPNAADALASAWLQSEGGAANNRQYNSDFETAYRNPDGSLNKILQAQDAFTAKLEQAYYNTGGSIPLSWYVNYAEDIELFEGVGAEPLKELYRLSVLQADAIAAQKRRPELSRFREEHDANTAAEFMESQRSILFGLTTVGEFQDLNQDIVDTAVAEGSQFAGTRVLPGEVGPTWGEVGGATAKFAGWIWGGFKELNTFAGNNMGWLTFGTSHATEVAVSPLTDVAEGMLDTLAGTLDQVAHGPARQQHSDRMMANKELRDSLGMSSDEFTLQAGFGSALEFARELPRIDPDSWKKWMLAAGGDTELATDMVVDEILFSEENQKNIEEQQEFYNAQTKVILQELEDADFSNADSIMSIAASYGEILETITTGITLAVVNLIEGDSFIMDPEYWQELENYEKPSEVLGLEGTLVGLGVDYGSAMAIDAPLFVYRAPLSAAGRWGAQNGADAYRLAYKSVANGRKADDIIMTLGKHQGNDIGGYISMEAIDATGHAEILTNAILGEAALKSPFRMHLPNPKLAGAYDHIAMDAFAPFADDVAKVSKKQIDEAGKRVKARGSVPLEIVVNPSAGRIAKLSDEHLAELAFYQREGHRLVPATTRLDVTAGVTPSRRLVGFADDQAEAIHRIAAGDVLKRNPKAKVVKGADDVTAKDLLGDRLPRIVDDTDTVQTPAGTVVTEKGVTMHLERTELDLGGVAYTVRDPESGKVVAGVIGRAGKTMDGDLSMATTLGRGTMEKIWDNARLLHDDHFILQSGNSSSMSTQAARFSEKYARKLIDDKIHNSVRWNVDEAMPEAPWARGVTADDVNAVDVDGAIHVRPRRIMPDEMTYGPIDRDLINDILHQHYLDGGDPISAHQTTVAVLASRQFGNLMRNSPLQAVQHARHLFNRINANTLFHFYGPTGVQSMRQSGVRMFAAVDDLNSFEPFARRFLQYKSAKGFLEKQAAEYALAVKTIDVKLSALKAEFPNLLDDGAAAIGTKLPEERIAQRKIARAEARKLEKEIDEYRPLMAANQTAKMDTSELTNIMTEMWQEFNRKHIATHPGWKKVKGAIDENGLVKDEYLMSRQTKSAREYEQIVATAEREGISLEDAALIEKGVVPKSVVDTMDLIEGINMDVNQFLRETHEILQHKSTWLAPASPLEMMTAATGGPDALKTVAAKLFGDGVSETVHNIHLAWVLDKVFTPRTGIVVSMDEMISYLQAGGAKTIFNFFEDQVMKQTIRINRLKSHESWSRMPQRWRDRITKLEEYPLYLKQQERSWIETRGVGLDEVTYKKNKLGGNERYYEAADRQAQGFMGNEGFVANLQGDEAFQKWWDLEQTAGKARELTILDVTTGKTRTGATMEQVREGYETMWQLATKELDTASQAKAKQIWLDGAERVAAKGSTQAGPVALPHWVLEGFGSVTGNAQAATGPIGRGMEAATNKLFQNPLDYRRGAMADTVEIAERARLEKLFKSQGRKIMTDQDMFDILKRAYPDTPDELIRASIPDYAQHLKETQGAVTKRYVDELIEQKKVWEIERRMYSFTNESVAGRKVVGLAPFGKPYADMMGRWTREFFSRPQLRGYLNNTNALGISRVANAATDALPFNPRTAGFLSRVANTDFDLDRIQEDPWFGGLARAVGLQEIDLGAGLFLFHKGQSPVQVLLPGMGVIPIMALDSVFRLNMPDPIKDPIGYDRYISDWASWVPSLGYQQPQGIAAYAQSRFMGGGTASKLVTISEALGQLVTGSGAGQSIGSQSWAPRLEAGRAVKESFADPNFIAELGDLTGVSAELGITALLDEKIGESLSKAAREQAITTLKEVGTELYRPVGVKFDASWDQLEDVWLNGMDTLGLELPAHMGTNSPEQRKNAAAWVRSQYHNLPDWERDLAVATNESLAVNLVSGWKWSSDGMGAQVPGNDKPYSTGGSTADFARHNAYKDQGYIEPMTPRELYTNIVGTILQSKERAAKAAYEEAVNIANAERWDDLGEDWHEWLDAAAADLRADGILPYKTGHDLWMDYTALKREYDRQLPPEEGESGFSMQRPWSAQMPSTPEELRKEFADEQWALLEITPKLAKLLPILGLDYDEDTPSESVYVNEIYVATADMIARTSLDNPIFAHLDTGYRNYLAPKSAGYEAFSTFYGKVLDASAFNEDTRAGYKQDLVWIGEALDRRSAGDPSWRSIRDEAVSRYGRMIQDDAFNKVDNAKKWNDAYGETLGSYDWVPDEPSPLIREDGSMNPNATQVWVRDVYDGDTVHVAFRPPGVGGAQEISSVRLLGWNAQELGQGGEEEKYALEDAISDAIDQGLPIAIVRDPERYGNTDMYGRVFGWLYIGEDVWYNPDTMIPRSK